MDTILTIILVVLLLIVIYILYMTMYRSQIIQELIPHTTYEEYIPKFKSKIYPPNKSNPTGKYYTNEKNGLFTVGFQLENGRRNIYNLPNINWLSYDTVTGIILLSDGSNGTYDGYTITLNNNTVYTKILGSEDDWEHWKLNENQIMQNTCIISKNNKYKFQIDSQGVISLSDISNPNNEIIKWSSKIIDPTVRKNGKLYLREDGYLIAEENGTHYWVGGKLPDRGLLYRDPVMNDAYQSPFTLTLEDDGYIMIYDNQGNNSFVIPPFELTGKYYKGDQNTGLFSILPRKNADVYYYAENNSSINSICIIDRNKILIDNYIKSYRGIINENLISFNNGDVFYKIKNSDYNWNPSILYEDQIFSGAHMKSPNGMYILINYLHDGNVVLYKNDTNWDDRVWDMNSILNIAASPNSIMFLKNGILNLYQYDSLKWATNNKISNTLTKMELSNNGDLLISDKDNVILKTINKITFENSHIIGKYYVQSTDLHRLFSIGPSDIENRFMVYNNPEMNFIDVKNDGTYTSDNVKTKGTIKNGIITGVGGLTYVKMGTMDFIRRSNII